MQSKGYSAMFQVEFAFKFGNVNDFTRLDRKCECS